MLRSIKDVRATRLIHPANLQENNNTTDAVIAASNDVVAASTTRMVNDTISSSATRFDPSGLPQGLLNSLRVDYQQEIKQFLQKPVRVASGLLTTSDVIASHLEQIDLPEDLLTKDVYAKKLVGFLGLRATIVLRLQVNASPFQQGRVMMHYVPQGQQNPVVAAWRADGLMRGTQLPNVQLDLATETEAILEIPYIAPTAFYDITKGEAPWGRAWLTVYSPLKTGTGPTDCSYTLWAYFDNIELITPTIEAQSGRIPTRAKKRRQQRMLAIAHSTTEAEEDSAADKPISYGLSTAASVADVLGDVPLISSFAKPASWVLDIAAGIASSFGYSKPQHTLPATKIVQRTLPYAHNCDGPDTSETLGVSAENKVDLLPGFAGTNRDEMTIQHIASIPAYYEQVTWASTNLEGDQLLAGPLEPFRFRSSQTVTTSGVTYTYAAMTPMAMLSQLFVYYRGSITMTMRAIKTDYHSGRLVLAYVPYGTATQPTMDLTKTDYCFREIIDLRESNEWTFTFPWASVIQWRKNGPPTHGAHTSPYDPYGYFYLIVETRLRAPDTASQSIQLMFEYAGASDMEFSFPRQNKLCPIQDVFIPTGLIESQSAPIPAPDHVKINDTIATSGLIPKGVDPVRFTIGERIASINQLLKRQSRLYMGEEVSYYALDFDPFNIGAIYMVELGSVALSPLSFDYFSIFGSCFAYYRGSVRIRMYPHTNHQFLVRLSYIDTNNDSGVAALRDYSLGDHSGTADVWYQPNTHQVVDIHVPMYSRFHTNYGWINNGSEPTTKYVSPLRVNISPQDGSAYDFGKSTFYRSVGDDFQFGFFMGVPPMCIDINP